MTKEIQTANPVPRLSKILQVKNSRGWIAVAVFMFLYAFAFVDRQILILLVDPIRADLGISDFQVSLLLGFAFMIFYTLLGLPIGWAVDRFSRRWIIFFGIVIWSICAGMGGLARNFWQLLLARFGVGAGEATLLPSAFSTLSDLFPKDRLGGATSIFSVGAIIGAAVALMIGGFVIGVTTDIDLYYLPLVGDVRPWQIVLMITGFPGLLIAFLVFLVHEPERKGKLETTKKEETRTSAFLFMKSEWRFYACHILGFSLLNIVSQGYAAWIPTYLIRELGMSVPNASYALGALGIIFASLGMLASGHFVDHLFRKGVKDAHLRYYAWAATILGIAGIVATTTSNLVICFAAIAVTKFIVAFIAVAAVALQITTPNQYRGQATAIFLFFFNVLGLGIGPSLVAAISDFALAESNIGLGIALTFVLVTPPTVLIFILGLKPMRNAVEHAESWGTPSPNH